MVGKALSSSPSTSGTAVGGALGVPLGPAQWLKDPLSYPQGVPIHV